VRATLGALDHIVDEQAAIRFGGGALERDPFAHLAIPECLDAQVANGLLHWFERSAPWALVRHDFYEQYEFALSPGLHPASDRLIGGHAQPSVSQEMEGLFAARFKTPPKIIAHRLVPGQRIDIHNDNLPGGETHRLLIQLNRGLSDEDGGLLMLFSSERATDVAKILRPIHRSAVAFAISDRSHHAVSRMHGGERFTLVYSFHADDR
jgi:hypothetical protein